MATFERDLLMRYVDLPFNRMHPGGSGFVSSEAAGSAASAAAAAAAAGGGRGGGEHGVPGFSAVDEDESESGVFSDKDFRNMSLKVRLAARFERALLALIRGWRKTLPVCMIPLAAPTHPTVYRCPVIPLGLLVRSGGDLCRGGALDGPQGGRRGQFTGATGLRGRDAGA